jgi:hypothetical protein
LKVSVLAVVALACAGVVVWFASGPLLRSQATHSLRETRETVVPTPGPQSEAGASSSATQPPGNAIIDDCFHVAGTKNCLIATPRLHAALALLQTTTRGPGLLHTAVTSGISIQLASLPKGTLGYFRAKTRTVVVDTALAPLSTRGLAAVLAHELRHVSDWAGIGRIAQNSTLSCYSGEANAFTTEVAVWKELIGDRPPGDELEVKVDDIAHAMTEDGLGFWLRIGKLYHEECL